RLDDLDPNSIESIDVLRGPSAASLYGTEAANGVIVIKTKKSRPGPFRLQLLGDQGWSYIPGKMPLAWIGWGRSSVGGEMLDGRSCPLFPGFLYGPLGSYGIGSETSVTDGSCVQDSVTAFNPANDSQMSTLGTGTAQNLSVNMSGGTEQLQQFFALR